MRTVVGAQAAWAVAGCTPRDANGRAARERGSAPVLAIGVAQSITALTGLTGEDPVLRGATLAVRDLNAEADQTGGPHFVVRVPRPDVRAAVSVAAGFRDDSSVVGVVGPTDSQSALDAVPVYGDVEHDGAGGLVAVSPTATSPVLSGRSPWLFRVCPDDAAASDAAARYAFDSLGLRRAAIVYGTNVFGRGWSRAFATAFVARGGTVVLRGPEMPQSTEWAEPYAEFARRERADALVVAGSTADALPFVRAARRSGLAVPVIGGDALSDVRNPGEREDLRAAFFTAFFVARRPANARGRQFVAEYAARYGAPPTHQAALAYDAALLLGRAARTVGGERRAIRDYLAGVGSTRPAFDGITGEIAFDVRHDVVGKAVTLARVVDQ